MCGAKGEGSHWLTATGSGAVADGDRVELTASQGILHWAGARVVRVKVGETGLIGPCIAVGAVEVGTAAH